MKSRSNTSEQTSLGQFELYCLMAVASLRDVAYGAAVHELLEQALRRPVPVSQVYICLDRLQEKGLVTSVMGEPEAVRGGRRKRLFTLEASGQRSLREATRAADALSARIPAHV